MSGNKTGKDNTGYRVPLVFAFEIIAAIMVLETAIPILPRIKDKKNNE